MQNLQKLKQLITEVWRFAICKTFERYPVLYVKKNNNISNIFLNLLINLLL